jgi:hypothetical protein
MMLNGLTADGPRIALEGIRPAQAYRLPPRTLVRRSKAPPPEIADDVGATGTIPVTGVDATVPRLATVAVCVTLAATEVAASAQGEIDDVPIAAPTSDRHNSNAQMRPRFTLTIGFFLPH